MKIVWTFFFCFCVLSKAYSLDINTSISEGDVLVIDAQDSFKIDRQKKEVTALGNVKAVKGDVTLLCDKLTLFYKEDKETHQERVDRVLASGNVIVQRQDQKLRAKTMTAYVKKTATGASELDYITAEGDLLITTDREIISAKKLIYRAEPDTVYLHHNVKITREDNQLFGEYGEVSRKTGVSKILPEIPGQTQKKPGRIKALIVPKSSTLPIQKKEVK